MSAAYRHCVIGLLTSIVWTLTDRLDDVYITDIVYLLDVLVVIVYMSYCNWGEICNWKKNSANKCSWGLKTQKIIIKNWGGGANNFWVFFPYKFFFQKCSWGSETHAKKKLFFGGGGGFWGVWGAPRPHPGVARGRKTIHFFLWPWQPVIILERSGLAVKSYHPETLAAAE